MTSFFSTLHIYSWPIRQRRANGRPDCCFLSAICTYREKSISQRGPSGLEGGLDGRRLLYSSCSWLLLRCIHTYSKSHLGEGGVFFLKKIKVWRLTCHRPFFNIHKRIHLFFPFFGENIPSDNDHHKGHLKWLFPPL